jgi:hypothetical protein
MGSRLKAGLAVMGALALMNWAWASGKNKPDAAIAPAQPINGALRANPAKLSLNGRYSESRVRVEWGDASSPNDVSGDCTFEVADKRIADVDAFGFVRPIGNGQTTVTAKVNGKVVTAPVLVKGVTNDPPNFALDVVPALTRAGCDMGSCHGAQQGKGGFKLSLQGFDADYDYENIARAGVHRRVDPAAPEKSLLLLKPLLAVAHKGGLRLRKGTAEYRILRDWIAAGMPPATGKEPHVASLDIHPKIRTLQKGQSQRYVVYAVFSDGSRREVTSRSLFSPSEEAVARVSPDGAATAVGPGEGAVLIRYQALVGAARVISPFAASLPYKRTASESRIDQIINSKLASLGLPASKRSSDSDFVRRIYLDVIGQLPSPEEATAFLSDRDPKKREKLIDTLFDRPEYVDFWTMKWGDLLRNSRRSMGERGMAALNYWIRDSVLENKPWDQMAREVLVSQGSTHEVGPANFFRSANTPETLSEAATQTFLGVRIQCARCHNHPYEKWTQNQYWEMASFFARVKTQRGGDINAESRIALAKAGDISHPKTQKKVMPCALDAKPLTETFPGDRREALAEWTTAPQNPFFAKTMANRIWKHFMGRGIVEPVDDMRATNPPSNEALLNYLGQYLAENKFDLKKLMKAIVSTDAYQRSSETLTANARDAKFYSHYYFKRLSAEQLMDAISTVTGAPERYAGYPSGFRATQLPDTTVQSYFLELFGRPARQITCECERSDDPNLGQILHLMNNSHLSEKIADNGGRVAKLAKALPPTSILGIRLPKLKATKPTSVDPYTNLVDQLYLAAFARKPSAQESKIAVADLKQSRYPELAAEDILWALTNSKEFLFNH